MTAKKLQFKNSRPLKYFIFRLTCVVIAVMFTSCEQNPTAPNEPPKPYGYQEDIYWPSLADSPWPMNHHDPQNTGRSEHIGALSGLIIDSIITKNITSGVVMGNGYELYFLSSYKSFLTAMDLSGKTIWEKEIAIEGFNTPLVDANGNIYATGWSDLIAFTGKGDTLWNFFLDEKNVTKALNIDKDGNLFLMDNSKTLYSITKFGKLKWRITDERFSLLNDPAISPDGKKIYIQGSSVSIIAIEISTGSINWTFGEEQLSSGITVDNGGNIYFLTGGSLVSGQSKYYFYSLNSSGNVRWKISVNGNFLTFDQATVDKFGNIYFGIDTLYSVSYDGNINWKVPLPNTSIDGDIVCDLNGNTYFGTADGFISAYSAKGNFLWKFYGGFRSTLSPLIIGNGMVGIPIYDERKIYLIK